MDQVLDDRGRSETRGALMELLRLAGPTVLQMAGGMFMLMGHEPRLARLETVYLQIVLATTFIKMVSTAFGQYLLAIDRPGVVFASAFIGVTANVLAAYPMILGKWGFASWGIVGAAWAQNIGVTVEVLV